MTFLPVDILNPYLTPGTFWVSRSILGRFSMCRMENSPQLRRKKIFCTLQSMYRTPELVEAVVYTGVKLGEIFLPVLFFSIV